ncbi:hypothetical protein LMG33818_000068 [Halomonadaceae bacterium LMG 33818]|uniref:CotH kinase family protein n=1 Tax=Cernens ardua TaxID=3402176 RepID=UPI003EDC5DD7
MALSDHLNVQRYASIAEVAAAEAKLYWQQVKTVKVDMEGYVDQAQQYAESAQQQATAASDSAQAASNAASLSSTSAASAQNTYENIEAVLASNNVYDTVAEGLSNTASGGYFSVIGGTPVYDSNGNVTGYSETSDYLIGYKNENGTAIRFGAIPNADAISSLYSGENVTYLADILTNRGMKNWRDSTNEVAGDVEDSNWDLSALIDVKAGDVYRLVFSNDPTGTWPENLVSFYQSGKPVGSLVYAQHVINSDPAVAWALNKSHDLTRQLEKWFIVPEDGQIKVGATQTMQQNAFLIKSTIEKYIANSIWLGANKNATQWHKDGWLKTPVLTALGQDINEATESPALGSSETCALTDYIPVKKGQFFNAIVPTHAYSTIAHYFDADKNFKYDFAPFNSCTASYAFGGTADTTNWTTTDAGGIQTAENYIVPEDGYIRILVDCGSTGWNDGLLYRLDDAWLEYDYSDFAAIPEPLNGYLSISAGRIISPATPQSPAGTSSEDMVDTLTGIVIPANTIFRYEYQVLNNQNQNQVTLWPQRENNIANGWSVINAPVIGYAKGNLATPGSTQCGYFYSQDYPCAVSMFSAKGTCKIEVLTQEEFVTRRNADIAKLIPVPAQQPENIADPYGQYLVQVNSNQYLGVGWIPMMPYEVLTLKSNYSEIRGFSLYLDSVSGNPANNDFNAEDLYYQNASNAVTINWDPSLSGDMIRTVQNRENFLYFGFQCYDPLDSNGNNTVDWENYFGDDYPKVQSLEDFNAQYIDSQESIPYGYIPNSMYSSIWDQNLNNEQLLAVGLGNTLDQWRMAYPFYCIKGQSYRVVQNTDRTATHATIPVQYVGSKSTGSNVTRIGSLLPLSPTPSQDDVSETIHSAIFTPDEDCIVYLSSRHLGSNETTDTNYGLYVNAMYQIGVFKVTPEEVEKATRIDLEEDCLYLPDEEGLEFKAINGVPPYDRSGGSISFPMQVWQKGRYVTSFMLETSVQGQGTAQPSVEKINWDLKATNKYGEKITFKIGNWMETKKLVLKSNETEYSQHRDTLGNQIFQIARRTTDGFTFDKSVLQYDLTEYPDIQWFLNADAGMRGVPATIYINNSIYGLYQLRTKKDEPNFAIVKKDKDFIFADSDYLSWAQRNNAGHQLLDWKNFNWHAWEFTEPSKELGKSYQSGDVPESTDLQNQILRVFNWIAGCTKGEAAYNFDDDAEKYLNMPSWIAYLCVGELLCPWDNVNNNVLMSCSNATSENAIWTVYMYDLDQILGFSTNTLPSPDQHYFEGDNAGVWYCIRNSKKYWPQACAMWKQLRQSVFTDIELMRLVEAEQRKVPTSWRAADEAIWGNMPGQSTTFIANFLVTRANQLDSYFKE